MCTIVAKKFADIGWIGVKNRDRPAATSTALLRDEIDSVQRVSIQDEKTKWTEGMNSAGISIISSSLMPTVYDPPVVHPHHSRNGELIHRALQENTLPDAIKSLKNQISGCVFVFDQDELFVIEGDHKGKTQIIRKITTDGVARTNHGIFLKHAGYQPNSDNKILAMRRISSESRLLIADRALSVAQSPNDLMTLLAKHWVDIPQMNTIRKPEGVLQTRTTEQLMLIPSMKQIFIRNIDGELDFTQAQANPPGSQILVGII
jgi:hypothetical protein